MKKILLVSLLSVGLLCGCATPSSSEPISSNDENNSSSISSEEVDYGTVKFASLRVFDNGYDGVKIQPLFSNVELCEGVDFEFNYEVVNEDVCEVDADGYVYYVGDGSTKVNVTSPYFEETSFEVTAAKNLGRTSNEIASKFNARKSVASNVSENTTLFLGDSFFEFWGNGYDGRQSITSLSNEFSGYDVSNVGISATTTHDWRASFNNVLSYIESSPKNIIVNIGINNVDDNNEIGAVCANNVSSLLLDLNYYFPESNIYYFSITRCSGVFASKWDQHQRSNELVEKFIGNYSNMHYLDVMELYGDNYAYDGVNPFEASDIVMGTDKVRIYDVKKDKEGYIVKGNGFTKYTHILYNGDDLEGELIDSKTIRINKENIEYDDSEDVITLQDAKEEEIEPQDIPNAFVAQFIDDDGIVLSTSGARLYSSTSLQQ